MKQERKHLNKVWNGGRANLKALEVQQNPKSPSEGHPQTGQRLDYTIGCWRGGSSSQWEENQ